MTMTRVVIRDRRLAPRRQDSQPQPSPEQVHSVQSCSACLHSDCPRALDSSQSWGESTREWISGAKRRLKEVTDVYQSCLQPSVVDSMVQVPDLGCFGIKTIGSHVMVRGP